MVEVMKEFNYLPCKRTAAFRICGRNNLVCCLPVMCCWKFDSFRHYIDSCLSAQGLPEFTRAQIIGYKGSSENCSPGQRSEPNSPTKRCRSPDLRANYRPTLIADVLGSILLMGLPDTLTEYPRIPESTIKGWLRNPPLKLVTGEPFRTGASGPQTARLLAYAREGGAETTREWIMSCCTAICNTQSIYSV
jgi:hypothetical protein